MVYSMRFPRTIPPFFLYAYERIREGGRKKTTAPEA
jgi:hypothetical protein